MGLFGRRKSTVETRLVETYAVGLQLKFGRDARKAATQWVAMARQQAEAEGTLDLDYDGHMKAVEASAVERERLQAKREDGVTEDDLRWWWGLHDLDRRMLLLDDDNTRMAFFAAKLEAGMSAEQAARELRRALPIYGDPLDTQQTVGDDRPLPLELKGRVNRWLEKQIATSYDDAFRARLAGFSSFNAMIRTEIRGARL